MPCDRLSLSRLSGAPPAPALAARSGSSAHLARRPAPERILDAIVDVVDELGYAHLTVQRIIAAAHVSRATFYQYFANVDDCFWAAYRRHAEELCKDIAAAVERSDRRALAALETLVNFAVARPAVASLLVREGLAAGPSGLVERDELIARIEQAIARPEAQPDIDLPSAILIGGAFRFLAMRRPDAGGREDLDTELREWAATFPPGRSRPSWSQRLTPFTADTPTPTPTPTPIGGVRPESTARERILHGTALAICAKGYPATTVADIVSAAGVSRRRFYNEFAGKEQAFIAVYEYGFRHAMATCSPAFFSANGWRERVWQGALAITSFVAREPLIARLGVIECYAVGPRYTPRVHDTQLAFTLFLEQGYRQRPQAEALSRAQSDLAVASVFEVVFQASRRGPAFDIRRCQPLAVYVALAPFIGSDEAGEFVIGKLSSGQRDASAVA
jgi:AcrR family transcriptional regulator